MEITSDTSKQNLLDRPFPGLTINWEKALFGIILILAIISRFYLLEPRVMSHDESLHTYFSWLLYKGQGFSHTPLMHGPFQFHALALSYFLFGDNDLTARIPAVLFNLASIAFIWRYRRYLGRTGALAAATLFTISPYMLYYGRYVRNEAFVVLFGLVSFWAVLRYLETGEKNYLYYLTAATALHFTSKETSFIYTAQILLFLGFLFLVQVTQKTWQNPQYRSVFLIALILAFALFGAGIGAEAFPGGEGELNANVTAAPAVPDQEGGESGLSLSNQNLALYSFAIGAVLLIGALVALFAGVGPETLKSIRSFELVALLGGLVLPHLSAFPITAVGWNPMDYTSTGPVTLLGTEYILPIAILRVAAFLIPMFILSFVLGMWWNRREWLINNAIFYGIFIIFFTTVFTNGVGFFTGLVGSLGYWLEQQGVRRGNQPWYYYMLIQVPVYEYLAALGTALAASLGIRKYFQARQGTKSGDDKKDEVDVVERLGSQGLSLVFFIYWTITSVLAYTVAGEKMPWLTVHIALPMILLAGYAFGKLIERIDWAFLKDNQGAVAVILTLVFLTSLMAVLANGLVAEQPTAEGQTLDRLENTSTMMMSLIALVGSGWGLIRVMGAWDKKLRTSVIGLTIVGLLTILTARHAFMASYINYDYAKEYLVYAHAAGGVKDVMNRVEDISLRTTDGYALRVAYDDDVSWPFTWYMRNYYNQRFYGANPTRDMRDIPVIIVGDNNFAKLEPIVAQGYYRYDYIRMWWPNQDYFDLDWDKFTNYFIDPDLRRGLFYIWLNRDYGPYGEAKQTDYSLPNWSPADLMRMYVRKDVAAQIWEFGVGPSAEEVIVDPYEGKQVAVVPDITVNVDGNNQFLFSAPRDLALAPDNTFFLADSQNHRIVHLDELGNILNAWGGFGELDESGQMEAGFLNEPWGVAVSPDGEFVYVADTWNHRIQKFTYDGDFVTMWGFFDQSNDAFAFWGPRDVVVDANGNVLVTNTGNKRIAVFSSDGEYLTQFGQVGFGPGEFDEPVGLAISPISGRLYVADTWNQRIQVFDTDEFGNYFNVNSWDINGWFGQSLQNKPYMSFDANGNLYVTDPDLFRVLVFDGEGQFLFYFGDEFSSNLLGSPISVISDGRDGVWVSDGTNNRLLHIVLP